MTLARIKMKRQIILSALLILTSGLFLSCDRIKNKSEQIVEKVKEKTKEELKEQTQRVIDKVYPPFDHDKPDTDNNKKRFKDFLKVEVTPDVKNIYCFDDAFGINADYMFAFNCNETTSKKIIEVHHLKIDSLNSDNGFGMQHDFKWWDKENIERLQKYSWTDGNQYFKYYWFDSENQTAYFFDFDM